MDGAKLDGLSAAVNAISQRLSSDEWEPSPKRHHLGDEPVSRLVSDIEKLLSDFSPALAPFAGSTATDELLAVRTDVAHVLGQAAAVLVAAGGKERASGWLARARELAATPDDRAVFDEAVQSPALFQGLMLAQWQLAHAQPEKAVKLARRLQRDAVGRPATAEVLGRLAEVETPLDSPPSLMTLNGFGAHIYGQRDRRPDGSYIGTRFLTALFLPLFPLDAFRMSDAGSGRYYFYARAPLSRATRIWRWVVSISFVALAVGGSIYSHVTSRSYQLSRALEAAKTKEAEAKTPAQRDAAISQYEALVEEYEELPADELTPVALGIARLLDAGLPRPLSSTNVEAAMKALHRFASLPQAVREGAPSELVCRRAGELSSSLESQGVGGLYAARRLLGKAHRTCQESLAPAFKRVRLAIARLDARDWPLAALSDYAQALDADESIAESAKLFDAIADDSVSVWRELEPVLASWLKVVQGLPEHEARVARLRERGAEARAYFASAERVALEHEAPRETLARALAMRPGDQELRVALAGHDPDEKALASLMELGSPGRMTRSAALAFTELLQRVGKVDEAEATLEQLVQRLLPEYEDARAAYAEASSELYATWYQKARAGTLPPDIDTQLQGASKEDAPKLFEKWVTEKAEADPELRALSERAEQTNHIVPMALSLGTLKLGRASQQTGAEQAQTLASAERLFLAIRSDAVGVPAYHMGLGQVYYRLGKQADGEREFGELLSKAEPALDLSVARAYREVGAITRAREVTQGVYDKAGSPQREAAALLMSLMADSVDDRRTWLTRADQDNTLVQTNLLELEADRACADGNAQEGDKKWREAAARHLEGSDLDESSFNNAALAQAARVGCTGQRAPLDEAISLMQRALRRAPDSSLLAENATPLYEHRASLRVLSRWLEPSVLRLDGGDVSILIGALEQGAHRDELLTALQNDPDVKQARALSRNARVLAPTHPNPYLSEVGWLERFEDRSGLRALLGAVRNQKLDTAPLVVARNEWLEGKRDKTRRERLLKEEAKLAQLLTTVPASHAPSLAAVRYLEGELATALVELDDPVVRAEQAVRAFEEALRLWPPIGAQRRLPMALLLLATERVARQTPALAARLPRDLRELGWNLVLGQLIDAGDPALSAIKTQPEVIRASELLRQLPDEHPSTSEWLVARLADDAPRAERLAAGIFDDGRQLSAELNLRLNPGRGADVYARFTEAHMPKHQAGQ